MTTPVPYESRVRPLIAAAGPVPWMFDGAVLTDAGCRVVSDDIWQDARDARLIVTAVNTAAASADLAEAVRALTKAIVTARRFRAPDCDDETTIIPTPKWDAIMSAHMDAVAALSRLDSAASSGAASSAGGV